MKIKTIFAIAVTALCLGAYFSGRAYQHSRLPVAKSLVSTTAAEGFNTSANFGDFVYQHIATIPFANLYETLRRRACAGANRVAARD